MYGKYLFYFFKLIPTHRGILVVTSSDADNSQDSVLPEKLYNRMNSVFSNRREALITEHIHF